MTEYRNIAITGRMAAGKSTISQELIDQHRYVFASFARNLKTLASKVYGYGQPIQKGATYPVTDQYTGRREERTGREILQRLGQSVKELDRDFWIRWMLADLAGQDGPFVLDDLRFDYEADALRREGWFIVKVEAPEHVRAARYFSLYGRLPSEAELAHPSETGVDSVRADLHVSGEGDVVDNVLDILDVASGWCSPHMKVG